VRCGLPDRRYDLTAPDLAVLVSRLP